MTHLVRVYSRYDLCQKVDPEEDKCLISISTPQRDDYNCWPENVGWADFLSLEFDDMTREPEGTAASSVFSGYVLFNNELAHEVLNFIWRNLRRDYYIHCDAGISRSGAVGAFMRDHLDFEMEMMSYHSDQHINHLVYRTLCANFREFFNVAPKSCVRCHYNRV